MGENSKIEWTDHTFNPWIGCTKVSPACDHCYAETWAKRTGQEHLWQGQRRRTTMSNWQKVRKWNREAEAAGRRARVFCASLADVFDNQADRTWRRELWHYIEQTPHLDWLLLTKRPQNIAKMLPDPGTGVKPWGDGWHNVWLGTTVENQEEADRRIPHLLAVPARVRFLSCEPLLGPVVISSAFLRQGDIGSWPFNVQPHAGIDWVICGGESGPGARPMHPGWARALRDQCAAAGVPFHFKQWGEWAHCGPDVSKDRLAVGLYGELPFEIPAGEQARQMDLLDRCQMYRAGKRAAGRLLDGREHNDLPRVAP